MKRKKIHLTYYNWWNRCACSTLVIAKRLSGAVAILIYPDT